MSIDLRLGRWQDALADVGEVDCVISDLAAGCAAEHIVCADLLLQGKRAFLADQNCPYDVAVEVGGRMIRVQVKGTRRWKNAPSGADSQAYFWHTRRAGKGRSRVYGPREFDVLALVALDIRRCGYIAIGETSPQVVSIRIPGRKYVDHPRAKTFDDLTFDAALAAVSR